MEIEKHWLKEHKLKAQNTIHDLILLQQFWITIYCRKLMKIR